MIDKNLKYKYVIFDLETLGLSVFDRIVAIGVCVLSDTLFEENEIDKLFDLARVKLFSVRTDSDEDEKVVLSEFKKHLKLVKKAATRDGKELVLVGYNCSEFDKKMLIGRGYRYDIDFSFILRMKMVDLYWLVKRFLSPNKQGSLGAICKLYNIPHDDTIQGWMTASLFAEQKHTEIKKHCEDDVKSCAELLKKLKRLIEYDIETRYKKT